MPGEGSVFQLVVKADAAPDPEPQALSEAPLVELRGRRVLIVDDSRTNRSILRSQIGAWGMEAQRGGIGQRRRSS